MTDIMSSGPYALEIPEKRLSLAANFQHATHMADRGLPDFLCVEDDINLLLAGEHGRWLEAHNESTVLHLNQDYSKIWLLFGDPTNAVLFKLTFL